MMRYAEAESNSRDRFIVIRENINKNFYFIRAKLDERERRKADSEQINQQIREKIEEIYNQLERMREAVASEKGANVPRSNPASCSNRKIRNRRKDDHTDQRTAGSALKLKRTREEDHEKGGNLD